MKMEVLRFYGNKGLKYWVETEAGSRLEIAGRTAKITGFDLGQVTCELQSIDCTVNGDDLVLTLNPVTGHSITLNILGGQELDEFWVHNASANANLMTVPPDEDEGDHADPPHGE